MPILSGCCFLFDLKVGTKIIGVLNLIGGLINTLSFAVLLVILEMLGLGTHTAKTLLNQANQNQNVQDDEYAEVREESEQMIELIQQHIKMVTVVLYILLVLSILMVITTSMLIHGIKRNKRGLLVPFIVQELVVILVMVSLGIGLFAIFGTHKIIVSSALSVIFGSLISLYFVIVVISQYQALGLVRMHEEMSMK